MKVDLKLLDKFISQAEESNSSIRVASTSADDLNGYLVDKILFPCLAGENIRLNDIDFEAFDTDDVILLEEFYCRADFQSLALLKLVRAARAIRPMAATSRAYC